MIRHNQDGAVSGLAISLAVAVTLLIGMIAFAGWAYGGRQDYKNNVDTKVDAAVEVAVSKESAAKDLVFAEKAKNPLRTYNGPEAYGSLVVKYPKTWSGYVDDSGSGGSAYVDGFFAPGVVPSISDDASVFALRVQVLSQQYSQTLQSYSGQQQSGGLKATAYALPKLPKVVGVKLTGQLNQGEPNVTMVVLPLRSETIIISTQGDQYVDDFNKNILPNFSFSP